MRDISFVWTSTDLEVARDAVATGNYLVAASILEERYIVGAMSDHRRLEYETVMSDLRALVMAAGEPGQINA